MFKKYAILSALCLLLTATVALSEAPTSQFGFTGWPYRQTTDCTTGDENTTEHPIIPTKQPQSGIICPDSTTPQPVVTTSAPVVSTGKPIGSPSIIPSATPVPQQPAVTKVPSTDDDYTTQSVSAQEQMMLNLVNQDRKNNGLPALTLDPELSRIARIKSCDMRDNHYFAHESPTYGNVREMLKTFGYSFSAAGENIAHHATVEKAQAAFMSSDGHRRNILSSSWTKVGIGICQDANGYIYATQIFAR